MTIRSALFLLLACFLAAPINLASAQGIAGLTRIPTTADDLAVRVNSDTSAFEGATDFHDAAAKDFGDDFIVGHADSKASVGNASGWVSTYHESYAFPPGSAYQSIAQLDTNVLVQGLCMTTCDDLGAPYWTWALAAGTGDSTGRFDVLIDVPEDALGFKLDLASVIDIQVSPLPGFTLRAGAEVYKRIGDSFVRANYIGTGWVVEKNIVYGPNTDNSFEFIPGPDLAVVTINLQYVDNFDTFVVEERTRYTFLTFANNEDCLNPMQSRIANHGFGLLQPRE